jgi:hypothetical protein
MQIDTDWREAVIFPQDDIMDDNLGPVGPRAVSTGTMPGEIARALDSGRGKMFSFYVMDVPIMRSTVALQTTTRPALFIRFSGLRPEMN